MIIKGSPDILDAGAGLKNQLGGLGSAASVKMYADRNFDGFFDSPEYINFVNSTDVTVKDSQVHDSPYFGKVTGTLFGNGLDFAFEDFQTRIQNPTMVAKPAITSESKLSNVTLLLLGVAAFYFLG